MNKKLPKPLSVKNFIFFIFDICKYGGLPCDEYRDMTNYVFYK